MGLAESSVILQLLWTSPLALCAAVAAVLIATVWIVYKRELAQGGNHVRSIFMVDVMLHLFILRCR